jgi:transcriptional regulator GlxA family with amidase domain
MNKNHVTVCVFAIKYAIDENPISRAPLKTLAPDIHVGRNQLQAAFKQITGKTIRRYRLEKRMEAAATMLLIGEDSIKEVAIACGHAECISNFSKSFKAIHNMCPEEWVRQHAHSNNIREMKTALKKCI